MGRLFSFRVLFFWDYSGSGQDPDPVRALLARPISWDYPDRDNHRCCVFLDYTIHSWRCWGFGWFWMCILNWYPNLLHLNWNADSVYDPWICQDSRFVLLLSCIRKFSHAMANIFVRCLEGISSFQRTQQTQAVFVRPYLVFPIISDQVRLASRSRPRRRKPFGAF
jgi:hypothetical protein